jgi:chromosome segregation ATPase
MLNSVKWSVGILLTAIGIASAGPVEDARWRLDRAESDYRAVAARWQQAVCELDEARAQLASLQREYRDTLHQRESFAQNHTRLSHEIATLESNLAQAQDDERRAGADIDRLTRDLHTVREQIARLRSSLIRDLVGGLQLLDEIDARNRAIARLEERARLIREDLPRWQPYAQVLADVRRYEQELADLERRPYQDRYLVESVRRILHAARAELVRMEADALDRDVEAREARVWIESADKRIDRLQSGIDKQLQNHPEMIRATRDEQSIDAALQQASRGRSAAAAARDQFAGALADARHRLSQFPQSLAAYDHRLSALAGGIRQAEARICDLEAQVAHLALAERRARAQRDDAARHYEQVLRQYQSRPRYPTPGRPDSHDYAPPPQRAPRHDDDRGRDRDQQDRPRAAPSRPSNNDRGGRAETPPPPRPAPRERDR